MNHKRGKRKNARAGCLLYKPNKMNGWNKDKLGHSGFGNLKMVVLAKRDLRGRRMTVMNHNTFMWSETT